MYDHEQQTDHAEHAAVTAELRDEQAAELTHEQQLAQLVSALLDLADGSAGRAARLHSTIGEQLARRAMIEPSTDLFMRRAAAVAHLAARAAGTLGAYRGYDLRGQVERLLSAASAADPTGVVLFAAGRVRIVVGQVLDLDARAVDTERANDL